MARTRSKNPAAVVLGESGGKAAAGATASAQIAENARGAKRTDPQGGKGAVGAGEEKQRKKEGAVSGRSTRLPSPNCVVRVGGGRGFVIVHRVKVPKPPQRRKLRIRKFVEHRLIVTAAHCLPKLPPPHRASYVSERTFGNLLASLDGSKKEICADCLFVDPVADIAVLGCPVEQELGDEADAYHALTEDAPVLRIGNARSGPGWVLSLEGQWVPSKVELLSAMGGASLTIDPTKPGMSGSPILNDAGRAIGIVAIGSTFVSASGPREWGQPMLMRSLPGWLCNTHT
jgi:hypothetical protein